MNHVIVTRVAVGVSALCAAAALLFAWLASAPVASQAAAGTADHATTPTPGQPLASSSPHPGEALFERYCGACHSVAEVERMMKEGGTDLAANAATMVAFLENHGKSSDEQDRIIVGFIRERVE